jgi:predicted CopG family antitoxin
MGDGNKRIPISEAAYEKAKAAKRDDENWSDYVLRCSDTPPETQELVAVEDALAALREHDAGSASDIDPDELASKVASRIDYAALGREAGDYVVGELEERQR